MRTVAVLLSASAVSGCASLGIGGCGDPDWRAIGREAGEAGAAYEEDAALRHRCADAAAPPDKAMYREGWTAGNARYCSAENGFSLGAAGEAFSPVCTGEGGAAFAAAYRDGESLYAKEARVAALRNRLSDVQRSYWDVRNRVDMVDMEASSPSTPSAERRGFLSERRALSAEVERLSREEAALAASLAAAEEDLAAWRARSGRSGRY